eukprot:CAMPEP_0116543302 /NCGR_PEP_ID=MMETSP0397-20121206/1481_1 /TAXON_ID=216820 /ORGANISM="Cyclophora tenuis, Strain ECT3854" /LENGTH=47 /DNA_ID= /DNA_START= /DNA_END= /DNA_ORIENTATION=
MAMIRRPNSRARKRFPAPNIPPIVTHIVEKTAHMNSNNVAATDSLAG